MRALLGEAQAVGEGEECSNSRWLSAPEPSQMPSDATIVMLREVVQVGRDS